MQSEQYQNKDGQWRCRRCGALLGIARQGAIEVQYKAMRYVMHGTVTTNCRRCSTPNEKTSAARRA